ncbi:MAG: YkgJ family cysteine cluster protein, partial [Candidatus Sericytochromatia bacterium]
SLKMSRTENFGLVEEKKKNDSNGLDDYFSSEIEKDIFFKDPDKRAAFLKLYDLNRYKLPNAKNLTELYDVIQEINNQIYIIYPNIECKSGCSRCCKFSGSPEIYKAEWEKLKDYFEANFSEKQMKRVKRKFMESIKPYKDELENDDENNLEEISNIEMFFMSECPFLYKNMCSVYEARPLICRIFGLSMVENAGKKDMYRAVLACLEEKNRWTEEYKETPDKQILLPSRLALTNPLLKFLSTEEKVVNSIQYWLTEYFNEY